MVDRLEYQILQIHKQLATFVYEDGAWPLYLLANKPAALRSGCHLGRRKIMLYQFFFSSCKSQAFIDCWKLKILVLHTLHLLFFYLLKKKKLHISFNKGHFNLYLSSNLTCYEMLFGRHTCWCALLINPKPLIERCKSKKSHKFPENYQTCINFFQLLVPWSMAMNFCRTTYNSRFSTLIHALGCFSFHWYWVSHFAI